MTLNILWSDDRASYVVADSARSHKGTPLHSHSLLQQLQSISRRGISVEEGAQKIVPITDSCVSVLCGNAYDAREFVEHARKTWSTGDLNVLLNHVNTLSSNARFVVGITEGNHDEAVITYTFPEREILVTRRGEIKINGSLSEVLTGFLANRIYTHFLSSALEIDCEVRLVGALAIATTMAARNNLTEQSVGGAFFGGYIENQKYKWQPDVSYAFYSSDRLRDQEDAAKSGKTSDEIFSTVHTGVRDNVSCAATAHRGLAALSELSASPQEWMEKWKDRLNSELGEPKFVVFVPILDGSVTVVARNMGQNCRVTKEEFAYTSFLGEILKRKSSDLGTDLVLVA